MVQGVKPLPVASASHRSTESHILVFHLGDKGPSSCAIFCFFLLLFFFFPGTLVKNLCQKLSIWHGMPDSNVKLQLLH